MLSYSKEVLKLKVKKYSQVELELFDFLGYTKLQKKIQTS